MRRGGKRGAPAPATFSAGDGSRLKPGALAPKEAAQAASDEAEAAAQEAPRAAEVRTAYTGKALRDGDGWAVEVDDAYEIRGYGDTLEEASTQAAIAVADAFGIPQQNVTIEVRSEEIEEAAPTRGRRRAVRPAVAVFQPPVFQAPTAPADAAAEVVQEPEAAHDEDEGEAEAEEDRGPRRRRRRRGEPPSRRPSP